jgi:hypothetical protein
MNPHSQPELLILKSSISSLDSWCLWIDDLKQHFNISEASIDIEDCDHVVRLSGEGISYESIIEHALNAGIYCSKL